MRMIHEKHFYIDGRWVSPDGSACMSVTNPATEAEVASVALANSADVNLAVAAARAAFPAFSRTSVQDRIKLLERIVKALRRREVEIAAAVTLEMGAPLHTGAKQQGVGTVDAFTSMIEVLARAPLVTQEGGVEIVREAIGVCGIISPWNAPVLQVAGKVAPALAAGCTMVVKPSELAPLSPLLFAEVMDEADVPAGVFNLLNGAGEAGSLIAGHSGVDMISFTGSTQTGIRVAHAAADSVKRVHQELGGKGANVILPDADLKQAVTAGVRRCFLNSGQVCSAPTRMLVPADVHDKAVDYAKAAASAVAVGDPNDAATQMGPLANRAQFEKVQQLIQIGIDSGARLIAGGVGRPQGLDQGFYARPTIFANVSPDMALAQTEIFGPVLVMIPYHDEADAIRIANGTRYGLQCYVSSNDIDHARRVARLIDAGVVIVNYSARPPWAPFGGYRQSGNGRQNGIHGLLEYTEVKAIVTA
jgi:aldehyde dehydrogenase (NAD+)